jgi:hypothetical protein
VTVKPASDKIMKSTSRKEKAPKKNSFDLLMSRGNSHYLKVHPEKIFRGEDQGRAILSEEKVIKIRTQFDKEKVSKAQLARENNVSESLIRAIVQRKLWTHI